MLSVVVPVYKNEANIPSLLTALSEMSDKVDDGFEAVFVVDGSPDESFLVLRNSLAEMGFESQLLCLSRNFGAFAAIRAGLDAARGTVIAVMAADLQEPPSLILNMHEALESGECDVAYGERVSRGDPWSSRLFSSLFWGVYRRFIAPEVPPGGVDIFAVTAAVRDQIMTLNERNSSLIGLLFWIGFERRGFPYERAEREVGTSAWTFIKKWRYMQDSIFSFTDLPISLLTTIGFSGFVFSALLSLFVLVAYLLGTVDVPGYAATILVILFLGMLQILSLGVLGIYIWRVFENTKGRPLHIVMSHQAFDATGTDAAPDTREVDRPHS